MQPPVGTEPCCGRFGGGPRNGVLAFPRHWHPTAMPPAHSRATQAPRPLALPPWVERHEAWAGSDQIEAVEATRDPRRPKRFVVVSQGQRGHPATGSRPRTPSYKFTSTTLQVAASPVVGTRRVANASCGASEPVESSTPWAAALPNPRRLRIPQQRSSPSIGRWTSSRRLRPPHRSQQQRRSCSGRPRSRSRRQRSDAYRAYRILLHNRKRARGAMKCPTLAYCTTPRRRLPAI